VFSCAASCEGRTFGDEKGCRAARCDGLELQNLLFQLLDTVQKSCSYHAPSLPVAAWRPPRRGFLAGFFRHFSAAHINYYFASTACLLDLFATDSVNLEECI
jgi:hypothetical protein